MPRVLISDALSERAVLAFRERGVEADVRTGLSAQELIEQIGDYDGLAVRSSTKVTGAVLAAASQLKVVGRAGIGVDNVDVAEATAHGVVVMNTPFGNAVTTAEHTIALMMALARQVAAADRSTKAGRWEKARFIGLELAGKTLGLIGCGNIGSIVAERAQGLKMRVIACDPFLTPERADHLGVAKVELPELLARADIISLHTPLNEATRNILSADALARVKSGTRIINCARGGLIDEAALHQAIVDGRVAGAALDVFIAEPPPHSPLFDLEQVIVTPHLGASTVEAQETVAVQVAEQMSDYLMTGAITNALNMPSISVEEAPKLRPYLALARQLGGLAGQLADSGPRSVRISYEGQAAAINTRPLTAVLLEGLLSPRLASVNQVNAAVLAQQRGIEVTTVHRDHLDGYQTLVRLEVGTGSDGLSVAGTLFGDARPRLVEIRDVKIDAQLGPHMLFVRNCDQPGLIGALGTILGDAGQNIATFHLGRQCQGGDAIALVEVDQPVPDRLVSQVAALPQVVEVRPLLFPELSDAGADRVRRALARALPSTALKRSA